MDDYRNTKYCIPLMGVKERKNAVKELVLQDHKKAQDMHTYISRNDKPYKREFMKAYNYKCAYCGVSVDLLHISSFEIDHFVNQKSVTFKSKVEAGKIENLVLACRYCNNKKNSFAITDSNKDELNPDETTIITNFYRDDLYYIKLSESAKGKSDVEAFFERLHLGSEMHRIDYLVMSMLGLQKQLRKKGNEVEELSNAITVLIQKRNLMST